MGTPLIGLVWLTTLTYTIKLVPAIRVAVTGAPFNDVVAELLTSTWAGATSLLLLPFSGAAVAVFLTWLFLARLNVNAFPEAAPLWGEPWAITAWIIPIVGPFIGVAVVSDIARNSVDGFARDVGQRFGARAWWWFVFLLAAISLPGLGYAWTALTGFVGVQIVHTGIFVTPFGLGTLGGATCAVIAAARLTTIVSWVSAEHRQRVERRWDGGAGARAAAGFDTAIGG